MTTRYGIADADGDLIYIGPADGFSTKSEALMFLICVPDDRALDWHIVTLDGDAMPPSAPLPPTPRYPA